MIINRYPICRCNWESMEHWLIHCPVAQKLWSFALTTFGVTWVMPQQVIGLMFPWRGVYAVKTEHEHDKQLC